MWIIRRPIRFVASAGALILLLAFLTTHTLLGLPATAQNHTATITLDLDKHNQTMSGWEATLGLPDNPLEPEWADYADEIQDRAVNEVGLNRVRLEIRSGAENNTGIVTKFISGQLEYKTFRESFYEVNNDNDDAMVINWDGFDFSELDWHIETVVLPLQALMEARGEPLIINLCYVSFRSGDYVHKDPEEYAEFVLATYLHMQERYGFVPETWEVILEPDLRHQMWNGVEMGHAMVATSKRLQENGFTPAFVVPSVTNMRNTLPYMDQIASVPGAMEHVVEMSYHRYKGRSRGTLNNIAKMATRLGIRTSMLEWWFGHGTHDVLHEDLKIGNVSAWQGRVLTGHFDIPKNGNREAPVRLRKEVRYNVQYFRHVRSGAVRVDAKSNKTKWADPLAFVNPDGSTTVVINAKRESEFVVRGLPADDYFVSYAIENNSVELPTPINISDGGELHTGIPGKGVLTITSREILE